MFLGFSIWCSNSVTVVNFHHVILVKRFKMMQFITMNGKIISHSLFLHAAISKPTYKLLVFSYFEPGASVFPKVFYFRKTIMKIGCILDCFCISLAVVSFMTPGNKSKPAEVSLHLQAESIYIHLITSLDQLLQWFLGFSWLFFQPLLSFPEHRRVQLVLIAGHYLHRFSKGKYLIHFAVREICRWTKPAGNVDF